MLLHQLKTFGVDERVQIGLLLVVIVVQLYNEIGLFHRLWKGFAQSIHAVVRTTRDYKSGRYYKPWKAANPTVILSTKQEIAELSEAAKLSQRAVYADMFGFKHTMNKLEHNTSDHKVIRTRLYGRLLQVNGPGHLDALYPHLVARLDGNWKAELAAGRAVDGGVSLPVAQTVRRLASTLMGFIFFGERLSADERFSNALLRYPQDMVKCMGAFQVTPSFISPVVHAWLTNRGEAMHHIQDTLFRCMGAGRHDWDEPEETKYLTLMYNMATLTDASDYWNAELLSQSLLGIWFAASHQPWMNLHFILLELCARPEWQERLRGEINAQPLDYRTLDQLPLLDGFIKETIRLNPLDTQAIRRKALAAYKFNHGSVSVPAGATVCVSAYDLMHDAETYAEPDTFDPTRHAGRFVDVSDKFPVWGYGSLACPGRLHAALVMKLIMAKLLQEYDLRLAEPGSRTRWYWETFTMPYQNTRMVLRERS